MNSVSKSARERVGVFCFAVVAAIVLVSLLPASTSAYQMLLRVSPGGRWDHFLIYGIAGGLALFACQRRRSALVICIGLGVLGAILEIAQRSIPGRVFDPMNELANLMGLTAGLLLAMNLRLMITSDNKSPEAQPLQRRG